MLRDFFTKITNLFKEKSGEETGPWKQVSPEDSELGVSLKVHRDAGLPAEATTPDSWHTWVVLMNNNEFSVHVAFRAFDGTTKYHSRAQISPKDLVAVRVGREDVEFIFRRILRYHPLPMAPFQMARLDEKELMRRHPTIIKL